MNRDAAGTAHATISRSEAMRPASPAVAEPGRCAPPRDSHRIASHDRRRIASSPVPDRRVLRPAFFGRLWIGLTAMLFAGLPEQPAQARHPGIHTPVRVAHVRIGARPSERHRVRRVRATPLLAETLSRSQTGGSTRDVPPAIIHAIQAAHRQVQIDPVVLLSIAWQESRFDPQARNHFSSARGLLQFTTVTWLTAVRDFGERHGLRHYASAIRTQQDGRLVVTPASTRKRILALRDDPQLQAVMAAELLCRERVVLEAALGRPVTAADLYVLHLLGPAGALDFLNELARRPNTPSADILGPAVRTNAGLFRHDGRNLSVGEAYAGITGMLQQQADQYASLFTASADP